MTGALRAVLCHIPISKNGSFLLKEIMHYTYVTIWIDTVEMISGAWEVPLTPISKAEDLSVANITIVENNISIVCHLDTTWINETKKRTKHKVRFPIWRDHQS